MLFTPSTLRHCQFYPSSTPTFNPFPAASPKPPTTTTANSIHLATSTAMSPVPEYYHGQLTERSIKFYDGTYRLNGSHGFWDDGGGYHRWDDVDDEEARLPPTPPPAKPWEYEEEEGGNEVQGGSVRGDEDENGVRVLDCDVDFAGTDGKERAADAEDEDENGSRLKNGGSTASWSRDDDISQASTHTTNSNNDHDASSPKGAKTALEQRLKGISIDTQPTSPESNPVTLEARPDSPGMKHDSLLDPLNNGQLPSPATLQPGEKEKAELPLHRTASIVDLDGGPVKPPPPPSMLVVLKTKNQDGDGNDKDDDTSSTLSSAPSDLSDWEVDGDGDVKIKDTPNRPITPTPSPPPQPQPSPPTKSTPKTAAAPKTKKTNPRPPRVPRKPRKPREEVMTSGAGGGGTGGGKRKTRNSRGWA